MKRRLLLLASIIGITVFGLPVMADVEVNYADLNPYISYDGHINASPVAEIVNNGDKPVYINNASFDVEDADNRLMSTIDHAYCIPVVLSPGEKGYIFHAYTRVDDIADPFSCHIEPHFEELEMEDESYRYELSDVALNILNGEDYEVVGRATNTNDVASSNGRVCVVWFDTNKRCIGVSQSKSLTGLQPGSQQSFEVQGSDSWMEDQTKIATYRVIIEEMPNPYNKNKNTSIVHIPYSEMENAQ